MSAWMVRAALASSAALSTITQGHGGRRGCPPKSPRLIRTPEYSFRQRSVI